MSKTKRDVIHKALERLGVISVDTAATAEDESFADDTLVALFAELPTAHGITFTWTLETVPDGAFLPLSFALATELGPHYMIATEPRSRAIMRLRAYMLPDDRSDPADTDGDGTVSTEERAAADRAAYY